MVIEFWVMRVLLHPGPMRKPVKLDDMTPAARLTTLLAVNRGALCCMPDGCICEPMEVFDTEGPAHVHREKLMRDNPGSDFRVALNTDVTV